MIKIENVEVNGWEAAIRGMRNPMNSWDKSDSYYDGHFCIGENDHDLMTRLAAGGSVHAKYRRMITVSLDITAPLYWWAELDTYKVGTVRNSCSFMHKGVSKPFDINEFSIKDERVYNVLRPLEKKTYELEYPYETDEYKPYTDHNGHTYRVYKNGFVIREGFEYTDNYGSGRTRHFEEAKATIYQNDSGYFIIKLSGRNGGHMLLHRLVAELWCNKPEGATQVNHKNGNKGDNSAENLEWVSAKENMEHGAKTGLYNNLGSIHQRYRLWKNNAYVIPVSKRVEFKRDCNLGFTHRELAEKWDLTPIQANNLRASMKTYEYEDLFQECYVWDSLIEFLNNLRAMYLETKDEKLFQAIRCSLPQGYIQRSTLMLNYEVLNNIYHSRKNHRLDEWRDFCKWIESLPYSEIITGNLKGEEKSDQQKT